MLGFFNNSFGDLGKFAPAAKVLVEKVFECIQGPFKPVQIILVAKAEAVADKIHAKKEIDIRVMQRAARKEANVVGVVKKSLPHIVEQAQPEKMDPDWVTNFANQCQNTSNEEMQELWARILAGEANSPGSFSKRTVNLVQELDKDDADAFTKLCGFVVKFRGRAIPLFLNSFHKIYTDNGISFDLAARLDDAGLIQFFLIRGIADVFREV